MGVSREQDGDVALGIVTEITATALELWIRGSQRFTIQLEDCKLEHHPCVGEWVTLGTINQNLYRLSSHDDSLMPAVVWDGQSLFRIRLNFLPLQEAYLYPTNAAQKNLVIAWTEELGGVPLVFKNTFKNHCFYEGEALINMKAKPVMLYVEQVYGTPWIIDEMEEAEYTLTRDRTFFDRFKYTGIVVKETSDSLFVFNKDTGLVSIAKPLAQDIKLIDWIQFHCILNDGSYGESKVVVENILPARIEPVFNCVVSSDGTITIQHTIQVPANKLGGLYVVKHLGNVQDLDGLINYNRDNKVVHVKSICKVDFEKEEEKVTFTICNVLDEASGLYVNSNTQEEQADKKKQAKEHSAGPSSQNSGFVANLTDEARRDFQQHRLSRILHFNNFKFQNKVISEGIVFSTGKAHVMVYSCDPAVTNNIAKLTLEHVSVLPVIGDCVEMEMQGVGPRRRLDYKVMSARRIQPLYRTRTIGENVLEVRCTVNIINSSTIYTTKFGHIDNYNGRLKLTLAHEGCNCDIWIAKIENNQLHWAVSSKPDTIWKGLPQPKTMFNVAFARPSPYKFIGKQYVNKTCAPSFPDGTQSIEPPEQKPFSPSPPVNYDYQGNKLFSTTIAYNNWAQPNNKQPSPASPDPHQNNGSSFFDDPAPRRPFGHCSSSSRASPKQPSQVVAAAAAVVKGPFKAEGEVNFEDDQFNTPANNNHLNQWSAIKNSDVQQHNKFGASPPKVAPVNNFVAEKPQLAQNRPAKEAFEFLGVCVSVMKDGRGVFVYTGSHPEQEAFLTSQIMMDDEKVKHGDWLDFNARFNGSRLNVVKYRRRKEKVYPTTPIRNTLQLTLIAHVPWNFLTFPDEFRIVHTEFVGSVLDDNRWVKAKHVNKKIEIVAIRKITENTKLPWKILKIKEF